MYGFDAQMCASFYVVNGFRNQPKKCLLLHVKHNKMGKAN